MTRLYRKNTPPPPPQTTMNILESDYEYLLQSKEHSRQPVYDILHKKLVLESQLKEEITELKEFLDLANQTKTEYRLEIEKLLQERKLII